MNPQPDPSVGNLGAVLFVIAIIFYTVKSIKENNTITIPDSFVIGYIESDPVLFVSNSDVKKTKIEKLDFESDQLYIDCVDSLVALGMKKKLAKQKAKSIFSARNPQPKTVQDFLTQALTLPT